MMTQKNKEIKTKRRSTQVAKKEAHQTENKRIEEKKNR